jgi:hypothetical protein
MDRSLKKSPYVDERLMKKVKAVRGSGQRRPDAFIEPREHDEIRLLEPRLHFFRVSHCFVIHAEIAADRADYHRPLFDPLPHL